MRKLFQRIQSGLLALLASAALSNPDFVEICSKETVKVQYGNPPYDRWLKNHNKLLTQYDGAIGIKTGFTKNHTAFCCCYCIRNMTRHCFL